MFLVGDSFGRVVFFKNRQFVNDDVETRLALDMRGVAHNFELHAVLAFRAAGKDLAREQRNLVRKAVSGVHHPVDSAFRYGLVGIKFLRLH